MSLDLKIHIILLIIWDKGIVVGYFLFVRKFDSINREPSAVPQHMPTYELFNSCDYSSDYFKIAN